ncbi:hypothetical protein BGX21_006992, partial [Mortierella sp. AD011]
MALEAYKAWCDQHYSHDGRTRYEIFPNKIIRFFEEHVFTRTTKKYYNGNKSYTRTPAKTPPSAKTGSKNDEIIVVETPIGIEAIKQTKNALVYLGQEQSVRALKPNPDGVLPLRLLKHAIANHLRNVSYPGSGSSKDRGLGCPIRDSYSIKEHLRVLKATWMQSESITSPYIREHFSAAIRHSMLLRDEDLRRLNLAD